MGEQPKKERHRGPLATLSHSLAEELEIRLRRIHVSTWLVWSFEKRLNSSRWISKSAVFPYEPLCLRLGRLDKATLNSPFAGTSARAPHSWRFFNGAVKLLMWSRFAPPACTIEVTCNHVDVFLYHSSSDCKQYVWRNAACFRQCIVAMQRHDRQTRLAMSGNASKRSFG